MAVYLVTGRLGSGKSLVCVGKIRDALYQGRKVATNLDLSMLPLLGVDYSREVDCVRVPDKPTVRDLEAIGPGNATMDETQNGLIVLDELAAWMNARSWGDKERQPVIDWLIHSRKKGWDVVFICQHANQIDKQVRESLVEFHVTCRRLDRMKVPIVSGIGQLLTIGCWDGRMPRIHVGVVRYGTSPSAPVCERWFFRATDLFKAYDTRQVFTDADDGPFSYLPPRLLTNKPPSLMVRLVRFLKGKGFKGKPSRVGVVRQVPAVARLMQFPAEQRIQLYKLAQAARVIPD